MDMAFCAFPAILFPSITLASFLSHAPSTYFTDTEFTQCLSAVGVNPSFSNTWPKCPSHFAQTISTLLIPNVLCVGIDSAFIALIERRPSASAVEFGFRRVQRISAPGAHEVAFRWVEFIVFSGSCRFGSFQSQDLILLRGQFVFPFGVGFRYLFGTHGGDFYGRRFCSFDRSERPLCFASDERDFRGRCGTRAHLFLTKSGRGLY